jgi:predicted dithiol-disulfide oxidoreductase (DUF899 family)
MTTINLETANVVSREEWLTARKELLAREKELTRQRDVLSAARRELPWVRVEKDYVFDSPQGEETLADLFDGRSQLAVYHFMFGPGWGEGCPTCSLAADNFDNDMVHLANRGVSLVAISRAPLAEIETFKNRMGWRFKWASSYRNEFNHDYGVWFTEEEKAKGNYYNFGSGPFPAEEAPGLSVFFKNEAGEVYHTYSCYARGAEFLLSVYGFLDLMPKGRDEDSLPYTTAWIRHHDRYGNS